MKMRRLYHGSTDTNQISFTITKGSMANPPVAVSQVKRKENMYSTEGCLNQHSNIKVFMDLVWTAQQQSRFATFAFSFQLKKKVKFPSIFNHPTTTDVVNKITHTQSHSVNKNSSLFQLQIFFLSKSTPIVHLLYFFFKFCWSLQLIKTLEFICSFNSIQQKKTFISLLSVVQKNVFG